MPFRLSRCLGVLTAQPNKTRQHYAKWLGLKARSGAEGIEIDTGGFRLFLDASLSPGIIPELLVEDLSHARADLRRRGFFELTWKGPGKPNLVRDPFGMEWNVHQGENPESWPSFGPVSSPIPSKILFLNQNPEQVAQFYAELMEEKVAQVPTGWVLDCGSLRVLVEPSMTEGCALCLDPHAEGVDPAVTEKLFAGRSIATDPFGVMWKRLSPTEIDRAIISAEA